MKKLLIACGIAMVMAAIPVLVLAQITSPDPQSSHILIQNLSTSDATVMVEVYDESTGSLTATDTFTIAGSGAATVHSTSGANVAGHRYLGLSSGFRGSMVVSSDQEVTAVNVNVGAPTWSHSAYESIGSSYADTTVSVPSIHWRDAQWAMVGIQNTGSVATTAVYTYYEQNGTVISSGSSSIDPGRSDIRDIATDIDISTYPSGVGAMVVAADQPLAVAVLETLYKRTEAYIGFPSWYGDTTIYLPSMHHNPYGQYSHVLVQNTAAVAASLVITYYEQDGSVANAYTSTIPGDGSLTYHTNAALSSDGRSYEPTNMGVVGSAVIVSNQPLVAVNVEVIGLASPLPYAYNGLRSDAGATSLLFASVHANPGGQWSHMLVQNLDSSNSNEIQLEYLKQDGSLDNVYTTTLAAAGAITFHTDGSLSTDGKAYAPSAGYGVVGGVKVTSLDGRELVGVNVETLFGVPNVYSGFAQ